MAPDFALTSFAGQRIRLSEHLGEKPVLLFFWSYFCFPCQKEMPMVETLYRELGDERLGVIAVSLDGPQYDERVLPFVEQHGITFPNAYDRETDEFFEIAERYGVVGSPTSFLLDTQGRVRFVHLGRMEPEVLKGLIQTASEQAFCAEITKPPPSSPAVGAKPTGEKP
jgi:peroxiredoxin